jgi:hypothetical protein
VADFFVVVGFFGWFVVGAVSKSAFDNSVVIDSFTDVWTPVIQPALGMYVTVWCGLVVITNATDSLPHFTQHNTTQPHGRDAGRRAAQQHFGAQEGAGGKMS